jgi:hypothetical protein
VKRVDAEDRGAEHSRYLAEVDASMHSLADRLLGGRPDDGELGGAVGPVGEGPEVRLLDWDPDAEVKLVASMLYPYTHLPEHRIAEKVASMSTGERLEVVRTYAGDRTNRRHRPGRALERTGYRFDVVSDYGAFRDLQRHRLLTVEWQELSPTHGFTMPDSVIHSGGQERYVAAMERSASLWGELTHRFDRRVAGYAVSLAYRIRYVMQLNAREAMHVIELRTSPQGHPEYRKVCQQMHRLIADQAGHRVVAGLMGYADHGDYEHAALERLDSERRAALRRPI